MSPVTCHISLTPKVLAPAGLQEFPWASPSGKGLNLTIRIRIQYPKFTFPWSTELMSNPSLRGTHIIANQIAQSAGELLLPGRLQLHPDISWCCLPLWLARREWLVQKIQARLIGPGFKCSNNLKIMLGDNLFTAYYHWCTKIAPIKLVSMILIVKGIQRLLKNFCLPFFSAVLFWVWVAVEGHYVSCRWIVQ